MAPAVRRSRATCSASGGGNRRALRRSDVEIPSGRKGTPA
jgi:hypothetical protein